ncbi:mechanosensitive ion channel domain-containing protein [Actinomycetaceae bacterium L2_0104]
MGVLSSLMNSLPASLGNLSLGNLFSTSLTNALPTAVTDDDGGVDPEAVVDATVSLVTILLGIAIGVVVGLIVALLVQVIARFLARKHTFVLETMKKMTLPLRVSLALAGGWIGMMIVWSDPATEERARYRDIADHAFLICVILAATWLVAAVMNGIEQSVLNSLRMTGESRFRRTQTQMEILHRIILAAVWVLGGALVLMTFDWGKALGGALFTSAGLVSVVVGIAAQSTLGNVFAGLQLAFSDSIRMGDIVMWEDEFTTVEEITLTYVVLKVWDGRRLIVPSKEMTGRTFENWTRRAPDLLGRVEFDLDWSTPIPQMRAELNRILERTDMWDGGTGILQVLDATGGRLQVGALLSGRTSAELTDLKYYVREELVRWIQKNAPEAAPHTRIVADDELIDLLPDGGRASFDDEGRKLIVAGPDTSIDNLKKKEEGADEEREDSMRAQGSGEKAAQVKPEGPSTADLTETQVLDLSELPALRPDRVPVFDRDVADPAVAGPPTGKAAGHESSIFTGSLQAEKRRQEFSGPGEDALKEREAVYEKKKAVETGSQPVVDDEGGPETQELTSEQDERERN